MGSQLFELKHAFSNIYSGWILWNLFLAVIPLALSFWLFRRKTSERPWFWWLTFLIYALFLPNAPYMLTDIIHLIKGVRLVYSVWVLSLVFIPLHTLAILGGFVAYVLSLIQQGAYLKRQGAGPFVLVSELLAHLLCAVGIYLGRFRRFNSWDIVSDPDYLLVRTLDDLTSKRPLLIIAITFCVLTVLYWIFKQIALGLILRIRYAKAGRDAELD